MKGEQGRRGPLSGPLKGLIERFSIEAIRQRQQADKSIEEKRVRIQSAPHRKRQINFTPKRGVTKRPLGAVRRERRAANKRARLARRVNRTS